LFAKNKAAATAVATTKNRNKFLNQWRPLLDHYL
jgi:hypothetical protein